MIDHPIHALTSRRPPNAGDLEAARFRIAHMPGFEVYPEAYQPHVGAEELMGALIAEVLGHERSAQVTIGPSEIGHPCVRWLLHKLAGNRAIRSDIPWRATVGTAIHTWAEAALASDNERRKRYLAELGGQPGDRWLTERKVKVGAVGGREIWGSCDVFDTELMDVWDWKTKTKHRLDHLKLHGPPPIYQDQLDLYGLGYALLGWPVRSVGLICLLREGELRQSHVYYRPFNRANAERALTRLRGVQEQLDLFGLDVALELNPQRCDYEYCEWCRSEKPVPTTMEEIFKS